MYQDHRDAQRKRENCAAAYYSRGSAFGERSEYAKAIADYDEAIKLNPTNFDIYISRGLIYEAKGDKDRAIADYSEAIKLNPEILVGVFHARQRLRGQAALTILRLQTTRRQSGSIRSIPMRV